ncbi:hypothetical protein G7K_3634-t1 [Saitoella complicata NRRL Y-17804]|uniref:Uncharacterized protein n=1 Tax=Saitoella complicata (strain BCRC 22490 / CBS 7301 / JCM 7358 / NBRC 10748 / NRRL Y-17804) TaxID=698492 RepID=A0A0E9NJA7_SAICN|nr:hypothetical protein G7K_3634-t1 [Saitoella complicata NRRL Y-17804]
MRGYLYSRTCSRRHSNRSWPFEDYSSAAVANFGLHPRLAPLTKAKRAPDLLLLSIPSRCKNDGSFCPPSMVTARTCPGTLADKHFPSCIKARRRRRIFGLNPTPYRKATSKLCQTQFLSCRSILRISVIISVPRNRDWVTRKNRTVERIEEDWCLLIERNLSRLDNSFCGEVTTLELIRRYLDALDRDGRIIRLITQQGIHARKKRRFLVRQFPLRDGTAAAAITGTERSNLVRMAKVSGKGEVVFQP